MATRYHRLARETPAYAWWRLPVAGVLGVVGYFVAGIGLYVVAAIAISANGHDVETVVDGWLDSGLDLGDPVAFGAAMITIAILLPIVLLAVRITGPRPVGFLTSVEGRMRWGWLGRTTLVAFVVYGVVLGATLAVAGLSEPGEVAPPAIDGSVVLMLVLVVVLTPVQAAAEEYVFRGYLLQLIGSWTRFATIPVLVSVPLFAAGHSYAFWGLVDVAIFGLTAAYLTIRTGGLEAGIAAHVANNVVLMVVDALGMVQSTGDPKPIDLLPTVVTSVAMVLVVGRLADRTGLVRTRAPIAPPPPSLAPMWPPPPYAIAWPPAAPQWAPPPSRPPGPVPLHPRTPSYPGELPPGWGS